MIQDRGWPRWTRGVVALLIGLPLLFLLILAVFPWGLLRDAVCRAATERFGRPVTIGSVHRVDGIGFHPTIAVEDLTIPQAGWAGQGDFARVKRAEIRFSVWPLLRGAFVPEDIRVSGLRLALVRDKQGRTNWSRPGEPEEGGSATDLQGLIVTDGVVSYRDAKEDRQAVLNVAADPDRGVRAEGQGRVRGAPVRIAFAGAAVKPGRWPFTADITGEQLVMKAVGTMDRPLDTDAMTLDLTAKADDLKRIDAVIEAGLFQTRPVQLTAHVRHERPRWTITDLKGRIGRSDLTGRLTVDKKGGRTLLDGEVTAGQLDFDDLSSAQGRAEAAALERRIGPRLVPNTRIDIGKIDTTDGTIRFEVGRVVSAQGASPITGLAGRMTMDHQLLTIGDIRMSLREGVVTGQAVIDQRNGAKVPKLSVDLRLRGASVLSLSGETRITGRVAARAVLAGMGETVRAAIGRADGRIGLVVANGTLPDRYATALGFDAGAAFMGDSGKATLRCLVLGVAMTNGTGRADPLIVDTSRSRLDGTGTVHFPDERLALRLTGAPKQGATLRLAGAATVTGTLQKPDLVIPKEVKSVGNIFKSIGRAITGDTGPKAQNAACGALARQVLR
ncbi:AsmA family protein [uncultured Sphingomonas sp.]|uniref:AsmA family protein n=1 Tax=uncultured Sphingomonas sp. TaxID=158754 RepID=UPI0025CCC0B9|nr:AsmA family protein [uncultured Sphingomonas sp.]